METGTTQTENYIKILDRYIQVLANKYSNDDLFIREELIQVGKIAIYNGLQSYKPTAGAAIKTHLMINIKYFMINYLSDNLRTIRLPRTQINNREQYKQPLSIENNIYKDADQTIGDMLIDQDSQNIDSNADFRQLYAAINTLNEKQQKVIKMAFGFNTENKCYTYREIGKEMDISAERVRQILHKSKEILSKLVDLSQI